MAKKTVDGSNVLYHYLQKSLQDEDVWLFQMLVAKLITKLGVWFPPSDYAVLPISLPYVVRDATCRGGAGVADQWTSPDASGYVRDDNSLVKNLVKTWPVRSEHFSEYDGCRLGNGFIAAHAWRDTIDGGSAARRASTNSFWPNLLWLPSNVAKLTDRPGSFAQTYVQAISQKLYRNVEVHETVRPFVDDCWALLPEVAEFPEQAIPSVRDLNFFEVPMTFFTKRLEAIKTASQGLRCVEEGRPVEGKVLHTRYTEGLPQVAPSAAKKLRLHLDKYSVAVEAAISDRGREALT